MIIKETVESVIFALITSLKKLSPSELSMWCMLNFSEVELATSCYFFLYWEQLSALREVHGLSNVIQ